MCMQDAKVDVRIYAFSGSDDEKHIRKEGSLAL